MVRIKTLPRGACELVAGRFKTRCTTKELAIQEALAELADHTTNNKRAYLTCKDGTMIAIYWRPGARSGDYGFDFVTPGRCIREDGLIDNCPGQWGNWSYKEAVARAIQIGKEQCGGILKGET